MEGLIFGILRYGLSLILSEILFPLFTAANYLNMTVSNEKALGTLYTNEFNVFLLIIYNFISYFIFLPMYTCVNILYSVK